MNAVKTIRSISEELVKERESKLTEGELKGNDLLTLIVTMNATLPDDEKMSNEEIKYQVLCK